MYTYTYWWLALIDYFLYESQENTVNDLFWLKPLILWTNDVALGTELVQRIMMFSLKNLDLVLTYRTKRNYLSFKFDFHCREKC